MYRLYFEELGVIKPSFKICYILSEREKIVLSIKQSTTLPTLSQYFNFCMFSIDNYVDKIIMHVSFI